MGLPKPIEIGQPKHMAVGSSKSMTIDVGQPTHIGHLMSLGKLDIEIDEPTDKTTPWALAKPQM